MNRQQRRKANAERQKAEAAAERRGAGVANFVRREIGRAIEHHQNGEFPSAAAIYREYLESFPENPRVLQFFGDALYQTGEIDEAIRIIERAIELDEKNAFAHNNLGNAMRDIGRLPEAANCYRQAIAVNPGLAIAHSNLGVVPGELGELEEAESCHRQSIALDPDLAAASFNLGNVLQGQGRLHEVADAYRAAIQVAPGYALAHNNLGNVLRETGEPREALEAYRAAVAADGGLTLAHYNLATLLKDSGLPGEALAAYREVLRLDPENQSAAHMFQALRGETTDAAPAGFVADVFDSYAPWFDQHLQDELGYRVPALMRAAVDEISTADAAFGGRIFTRALDLGCGTGLVGAEFQDCAGAMDGVDLSARMLAVAARKNLYQDLVHTGIEEFLAARDGVPAAYDLVLAGDVFIYIGRLDQVFAQVADCLLPGGLFAFSIERAADADFELRTSGRYAQSSEYIRILATGHGFTIATENDITVRIELDAPVAGAVFVLEKTG